MPFALLREQNIAGSLAQQMQSSLYPNIKLHLRTKFGVAGCCSSLWHTYYESYTSLKSYFWQGKMFRIVLTAQRYLMTDDELLLITVCIICSKSNLRCITQVRAVLCSVHKREKQSLTPWLDKSAKKTQAHEIFSKYRIKRWNLHFKNRFNVCGQIIYSFL